MHAGLVDSGTGSLARRQASRARVSGYVGRIAGTVLVAAAIAKAYGLFQDPTHQLSGHELLFLIAQIGLEFVLGTALLVRKDVWVLTLIGSGLFAVFACVAVHKAAIGVTSCGCLGRLTVPPLYIAVLDVLIMLGLASFPPPHTPLRIRRATRVLAGMTFAAILVTAASARWIQRQHRVDFETVDGMTETGRVYVLQPAKWVSRRLPLLDHINVNGELSAGMWTIMLWHHDCAACREAIPKYEQIARDGAQRVALIEMPPYAPPGESIVSAESPCLLGKLSDQREWFATTPVVIDLRDGIVIKASDGNDVNPQLSGK